MGAGSEREIAMEYHKSRPVYLDYLLMLTGTAVMAMAINSVYEPVNLVTGGFTGAAIVIKEVTSGLMPGGIPLWLTNLALNIPVFLLGMKIKGLRFLKRTLFATVSLSFWLYVLPGIQLGGGDLFLSSVYGGVIAGLGIGMVLMARGTTGGTDLVAALIQHYLKHYSIVQVMQVIDGIIVLFGAFLFGMNRALYAIIAIFITSIVSDRLIEGVKFAKTAFIITDRKEEVSRKIMQVLGRGVTSLDVQGAYSGNRKCMLFCVVSKKEIVDLKEVVSDSDPDAFIVVSDAREVLGEGFLEKKA